MEKIEIENSLGLTVYINGKPNLAFMPKETLDALCTSLLALMESELNSSEVDTK